MQNWQRVYAYITGSIVFGLLIILLSRNFIQYVDRPGTTGYLFLIGFALIYFNVNFGISRRFVLKDPNVKWVCYVMAVLIITPTLFWVFTKNMGLGGSEVLFDVVVVTSTLFGSYIGIWRGGVKREKYIQQIKEEERELPDELKRPHDDLSKN